MEMRRYINVRETCVQVKTKTKNECGKYKYMNTRWDMKMGKYIIIGET